MPSTSKRSKNWPGKFRLSGLKMKILSVTSNALNDAPRVIRGHQKEENQVRPEDGAEAQAHPGENRHDRQILNMDQKNAIQVQMSVLIRRVSSQPGGAAALPAAAKGKGKNQRRIVHVGGHRESRPAGSRPAKLWGQRVQSENRHLQKQPR